MITLAESGLTAPQYDAIKNGTYTEVNYKVVAHRYNPKFLQVGSGVLAGTAPFYSAKSATKIFVAPSSNHFHIYTIATGVWTTGVSPFSAECRLYHDGTNLYAFALVAGVIQRKVSTDDGASWAAATTVVAVLASNTITKFAVLSETKVHYVLKLDANNIYQIRYASFSGTWTTVGNKLYYPYPIDDISVALAPNNTDHVIALETETPGASSAEGVLDGNTAVRYTTQQTAIITFTYKVATNDYGYHSVLDECNRYNNPDDVTGVAISQINGQLFVSTLRTRGVQSASIQNFTEYQSFDGNFWSIGAAINLPTHTAVAKYWMHSTTHVFAVGRDGRMWKTDTTLHFGLSSAAVQADITADVDDLTITRAEMLNANFRLHNNEGTYDAHAIVNSSNRLAYKIYALFDTSEVFLGTVYQDSQSPSEETPEALIAISARDQMAWMTDYYKAEDFKQFDPDTYRVNLRPTNFLSQTVYTSLPANLVSAYKGVMEIIGSKAFPACEFNLLAAQSAGIALSIEDAFWIKTAGVYKGINSFNASITATTPYNGTYYGAFFKSGSIYLYTVSLVAVAGRYPADSTGIGGTVGLLTGANSHVELNGNIARFGSFYINRGGKVNSTNYIQAYAAFSRIASTPVAPAAPEDLSFGTLLTGQSLSILRSGTWASSTVAGFVAMPQTYTLTDNNRYDASGNVLDLPYSRFVANKTYGSIAYDYDWLEITAVHPSTWNVVSSDATYDYNAYVQLLRVRVDLLLTDNSSVSLENAYLPFAVDDLTNVSYVAYTRIPNSLKSKIASISIDIEYSNVKMRQHKVTGVASSNGVATTRSLVINIAALRLSRDVIRTGLTAVKISNKVQKFRIKNVLSGVTNGMFLVHKSETGAIKEVYQIYRVGFGHLLVSNDYSIFQFVDTTVNVDIFPISNSFSNGIHHDVTSTSPATRKTLFASEEIPTQNLWLHYNPAEVNTPVLTEETDPTKYNTDSLQQQEYLTLDPGEPVMGGLSRAVDGRYIKLFMRYNGTLIPYQWVNKASSHTFVDGYNFSKQIDQRELHSHVRMLGAYVEAEYIDAGLLETVGHRFTEASNPYLLTEPECLAEAKNHVRRMKEAAETGTMSDDFLPFLEPEDRFVVTGEGDWILDAWTVNFENGGAIADYQMRRWSL